CPTIPPPSFDTPYAVPDRSATPVDRRRLQDIGSDDETEDVPTGEFWSVLGVIAFLVMLGGIFAGLTIGLMSLDETNLAILKVSGSPKERAYAARIQPIRKNAHLLLVTLLLGNTIVNESLPILMDTIHLEGYKAVLISTALIVIFGEIIPQAVCARHGLQVGALFAWPVRILMWIMYPVAYPVARLLDWILGHKHGMIYRKAELKELVALHGEDKAGPLTRDEVSIIRAVLDLREKSVANVMTTLEHVFMLPLEAKLNQTTIEQIERAGHSRVPVYKGHRTNIVGVVLVKQLVSYDPAEEVPVSSIKIRRLPRVMANTQLFEILHVFEEGGSHMAVVVDEIQAGEVVPDEEITVDALGKSYKTLGIITLEDVIEELLGEEIIDETDVYVDVATKLKVARVIKGPKPIASPNISTPAALHAAVSNAAARNYFDPHQGVRRSVEADDESSPLLKNSVDYGGIGDAGPAGGGSPSRPAPKTPGRRRKARELIPAGVLAVDLENGREGGLWRGPVRRGSSREEDVMRRLDGSSNTSSAVDHNGGGGSDEENGEEGAGGEEPKTPKAAAGAAIKVREEDGKDNGEQP
ncbi:hypothetical protein HK104_002345, partial [Borealophlyctis nickersoniae]